MYRLYFLAVLVLTGGFFTLTGCPSSNSNVVSNLKEEAPPPPRSYGAPESKDASTSLASKGDAGTKPPPPRPVEPPKPNKTYKESFAEGVQLAKQSKFLEAIKSFKAAADANAKLYQAWNNIGILQTRVSNFAAAEVAYRKALQIKPNFVPAALNLSRLMIRQGRRGQAIMFLENKKTQNPKELAYQNALIAIYTAQGQLSRSEQLARAIQKKHEKNVGAIMNLGKVWFKQKKYELARTAFDLAAKNQRRNPTSEPYYHLGLVYDKLKDANFATENLKKALSIRDSYPEAHNKLGVLLMKAGKVDEARKHFQSALKYQPSFWDAMLNLGNALSALKKFPEAMAQYKKLLSKKPNYNEVHYHMGILYLDRKNLKGTIPVSAPPGAPQKLQLSKRFSKRMFDLSRLTTCIYHLRTYINANSSLPSNAPVRSYLEEAQKKHKRLNKRMKSMIKNWFRKQKRLEKKRLRMLKKKQKAAAEKAQKDAAAAEKAKKDAAEKAKQDAAKKPPAGGQPAGGKPAGGNPPAGTKAPAGGKPAGGTTPPAGAKKTTATPATPKK